MNEQQDPQSDVVDDVDHDVEDVAALLARETGDGAGDVDSLPPEDFQGFASDDVEDDA